MNVESLMPQSAAALRKNWRSTTLTPAPSPALVLALALCCGLIAMAFAPQAAQASELAAGKHESALTTQGKQGKQAKKAQRERKVKKGWVRTKSGWRYYLKNGKAAQGLKRIQGTYYYFNAQGILRETDLKTNGATFYIDSGGYVIGAKYRGKYYYETLKRMTQRDAYNFETYLMARKVIAETCNEKDSPEAKKRKLFDWAVSIDYTQYYWQKYGCARSDWITFFAHETFKTKKGNCHNASIVYGYLLRALGYNPLLCVNQLDESSHAWLELDGKRYDPIFAKWNGPRDFYEVDETGFYDDGGNYWPFVTSDSFEIPWFSSRNASRASKVPRGLIEAARTGTTGKGSTMSYFEGGKKVKNAWRTINGKRYYFDKKGKAVTGSAKIGGKYYVFSLDGALQNSKQAGERIVSVGASRYRVNKKGSAVAGWSSDSSRYFNARGKMLKSTWKKIGGSRYYFKKSGKKATGCTLIGSSYYLFGKSGKALAGSAKNGWLVTLNSKTFRVNQEGKALPGWSKDGTRRFGTSGKLLRGTRYIGGLFYAANKHGMYLKQHTKQLNRAAASGERATTLRKLLGAPLSETYSKSCNFAGDDGLWEYPHFYVMTQRPNSVGKRYKTIEDAIAAENSGERDATFESIASIIPK